MNWEQLQEAMSGLELADQIRFAEIKKVEVPKEVLEGARAELEAAEAETRLNEHVCFQYGTAGQPGRMYLKTKGLSLGKHNGKAAFAKGLFLETRSIDEALQVLQRARAVAAERGIPTSPTEDARNAGLDTLPQSTDRVPSES